jgi:archaellum component FlaC
VEKKNNLFVGTFIILLLLFIQFRSSNELNNVRRQLDTVRNDLVRAEEYNRELTERLGNIQVNATKLGELTERNISGVRECIELVEEIRAGVKKLEDCIYDNDSIDDYYNYWDNIYGLQ